MPKLKPGDKAPDFTIKDLEGRPHRLYDYLKGQKVVLLFYRGEWCPICNLQLHALQDKLGEIQKANARIVAVSSDTPENSQKLVGKHNLSALANKFGDVFFAKMNYDARDDMSSYLRKGVLSFPVLAGLSREVVEAYGLFFSEKKGHAEPVRKPRRIESRQPGV